MFLALLRGLLWLQLWAIQWWHGCRAIWFTVAGYRFTLGPHDAVVADLAPAAAWLLMYQFAMLGAVAALAAIVFARAVLRRLSRRR